MGNNRPPYFPLSFNINDEIQSDDHCIKGRVVFDGEGEPYVAYYEKKEVKLIKLDYHCGDWEKVK